jgi:hypothetical protein
MNRDEDMRVVNSLDELLELPADRCVNGFRARTPVKLEIPDLSTQVQTGAQEALNGLQVRGGSLAGAVFMFLTLLYGVTQIFHRTDSLMSWEALVGLAAVLVVSFGVGFVAKYAALLVTRWRFARLCRAYYRLLSAMPHTAAT